jgi:hypothetical protein
MQGHTSKQGATVSGQRAVAWPSAVSWLFWTLVERGFFAFLAARSRMAERQRAGATP